MLSQTSAQTYQIRFSAGGFRNLHFNNLPQIILRHTLDLLPGIQGPFQPHFATSISP